MDKQNKTFSDIALKIIPFIQVVSLAVSAICLPDIFRVFRRMYQLQTSLPAAAAGCGFIPVFMVSVIVFLAISMAEIYLENGEAAYDT